MWNQSPAKLEAWYRRDAADFAQALEAADDHPSAATWRARLAADAKPASNHSFTFAIVGSMLIASFLSPSSLLLRLSLPFLPFPPCPLPLLVPTAHARRLSRWMW